MSEQQCDHWNTCIPGMRIELRPIRCRRQMGHDRLHVCGSTSWSESAGERRPDAADLDDERETS